ncbi:MAG: hypothetical protein KIS30_09050 [Thermoplasmata archaeon]|nr:hypothetical protein [Candidatus Sysuiplasma acidicola]MBX8646887.1 hypothetical protein [Candidatus Sysuiplasma acidicola]
MADKRNEARKITVCIFIAFVTIMMPIGSTSFTSNHHFTIMRSKQIHYAFASIPFLFPVAGSKTRGNDNFNATNVNASQGTMSPDRLPPPPPSTVSVTIYIYKSQAQVNVAGTTYSNGQTTTLDKYSVYSISPVSIAGGDTFLEWMTSAGFFISSGGQVSTSSTDSFEPTGNGDLVLVPNSTVVSNWAGYEQSGSAISGATGTFNIPITQYTGGVTNGPSSEELVYIWVGIGGTTSESFWQAGIGIDYANLGSSPRVFAWYEDPAINPSVVVINNFYPHEGDNITVTVSYSSGTGSYIIQDNTNGKIASGSENNLGSIQQNTAEWIVEWTGYVLPSFSNIPFSFIGSNTYNAFHSPVKSAWNSYTWDTLLGTLTQKLLPTKMIKAGTASGIFKVYYKT